jgi:hypothetical protein
LPRGGSLRTQVERSLSGREKRERERERIRERERERERERDRDSAGDTERRRGK